MAKYCSSQTAREERRVPSGGWCSRRVIGSFHTATELESVASARGGSTMSIIRHAFALATCHNNNPLGHAVVLQIPQFVLEMT